MAIELKVQIEGDKELSRRLLNIPRDIGQFYRPLAKINTEVRASIEANYSARGALFGKWVPRKDGKPHPLLEKTGAMRNSFTSRLGSDYLEIGNFDPKFPYHQSNKERKKIPRRVMMKIDRERQQFIVKEFQKHVMEAIGKS